VIIQFRFLNYSFHLHIRQPDVQIFISRNPWANRTISTNLVSENTATMSAFPPQRSTPSIPISQSLALSTLQAYLESAQSLPYLLPNARLEPSGPTAGSSSGSITIHNLQRVEAGLRGEWLAPVLDFDEGPIEVEVGMEDGVDQEGGDKMGVEGWQDPDEYAREQSIEEGDVEPESTALGQEKNDSEGFQAAQKVPKKKNFENRGQSNGGGRKVTDKEARKEAKKQKRKEEKITKEEARKQAAKES
jgi:hypothetical protein